ncbi:MAG: hypothetical protein IT423_20515 [Pirellulaceae bacterium]|nr:hypothetical protein [Pirellulaceae bacterium]
MSKESLTKLLEANGTFPDEVDVLSSFDSLFALGEQGLETIDDLAWALGQALDQLANVNSRHNPDLAKRLEAWAIANWTTFPPRLCERLCGILVNVASPESLRFMKDQREQTSDGVAKMILGEFIQDHPAASSEKSNADG